MLLNLYKPKCQDYHEERFDEYDFKWKLIYMIPHVATYETKKPVFFSINSLKMYYILIKSYFILVQSPSLHAPSVSYLMNHRSIFFMNVPMDKIYHLLLYLSERVALSVFQKNPFLALLMF